MLYVAYGSNLNKDQMKYRVPGAKPYGKGVVYNWQLDFHGNDGTAYATITQAPGRNVPVVLWKMSDKDEAIMDRFEGYPTSYYKKKIPVHVNGKKLVGTVYIMNESRRVARPSRKYVNTVRLGYEAFGLDLDYLTKALERNSRDFYLDDLLEVREFKTFKKSTVKYVKANSNKKSGKKEVFKWKTSSPKSFDYEKKQDLGIPVGLGDYMKKTFPSDPYWGSTYGYDDDYSTDFFDKTNRPSMDDYDMYGGSIK